MNDGGGLMNRMPQDELIGVASDCKEVLVETGKEVITQGQPAQAMYLVRSGIGTAVKTLCPHDGKTKTIEIGKAWSGHLLGERALHPRGSTYPFTVTADTRMLLLELQLVQVSDRTTTKHFAPSRPCRHGPFMNPF